VQAKYVRIAIVSYFLMVEIVMRWLASLQEVPPGLQNPAAYPTIITGSLPALPEAVLLHSERILIR
jgi:hypothetical protein